MIRLTLVKFFELLKLKFLWKKLHQTEFNQHQTVWHLSVNLKDLASMTNALRQRWDDKVSSIEWFILRCDQVNEVLWWGKISRINLTFSAEISFPHVTADTPHYVHIFFALFRPFTYLFVIIHSTPIMFYDHITIFLNSPILLAKYNLPILLCFCWYFA